MLDTLLCNAEAAIHSLNVKAPAASLPKGPWATGPGTAVPLEASHKQLPADQVSAVLATHSGPSLTQPSPQQQAGAASAQLDTSAQPDQATGKGKSARQTGGEVKRHARKRGHASRAYVAQVAEPCEAQHHKRRGQALAATAPAPDASHSNQDPATSLQAAAGPHGVGVPGTMVLSAYFHSAV